MTESLDTEITMYRGDNFDRLYIFKKKSDGTAFVLTGAVIKLTVRKGVDLTVEFQLTNADQSEIEDSDLVNGQFIIHIKPIDTSSMTPSMYIYDIQITIAGKTKTYVSNMFKLKGDVTD